MMHQICIAKHSQRGKKVVRSSACEDSPTVRGQDEAMSAPYKEAWRFSRYKLQVSTLLSSTDTIVADARAASEVWRWGPSVAEIYTGIMKGGRGNSPRDNAIRIESFDEHGRPCP
jgi:hypothetical protein